MPPRCPEVTADASLAAQAGQQDTVFSALVLMVAFLHLRFWWVALSGLFRDIVLKSVHFRAELLPGSSKCSLLAFPRQAVVEKFELQISADVKKLKCHKARKFCRSQSHGTHFSHIRGMGKIRGARRHALVTHVRHSRAVGQDTSPRAGQKCQIFWTHAQTCPSVTKVETSTALGS